jgi:hypothetical protein
MQLELESDALAQKRAKQASPPPAKAKAARKADKAATEAAR